MYKTEATPKALAGETPVFCAHDEIIETVKLIPNPKNPNKHPESQIELLAKIITATGWRQPITVSRRSGFVVKGHGRLMAAQAAGLEYVPVDFQDYASEAEEYADLVADNRLAELSEIDNKMLANVFTGIDMSGIPADMTGYTEDEIKEINGAFSEISDADIPGQEEPSIPDDFKDISEMKLAHTCPRCGFEFE